MAAEVNGLFSIFQWIDREEIFERIKQEKTADAAQ
jgi:hypothetical protein